MLACHACAVRAALFLLSSSAARALILDRETVVPGAQLKFKALLVADNQSHLFKPLQDRLRRQASPPVFYLFGDSTMRNQWMALCSLIAGTAEPSDPNPEGGPVRRLEENEKVAKRNYCTSSLGSAFLYHTWEPIEADFVEKTMSWGYPAPTVIYLNSGLHVLRGLGPAGQNWNKKRYQEFRDYEATFTSAIQKFSIVAPKAKVAVMLSHCICESLFVGEWGKQIADFGEDPVKATATCTAQLHEEGVQLSDVQVACQESMFLRQNIMRLNDRMTAAVRELQVMAPSIVDAFKLTDRRCEATFDGVHYNYLVLDELKLLFDALDIS